MMFWKDLSRHNQSADIALNDQPKELDLGQPRSVQAVEFDRFAPIGLVHPKGGRLG